MGTCHYCKCAFAAPDLRPYGPEKQDVCEACATSPANESTTERMFMQRLDEVIDERGGVVTLTIKGHVPITMSARTARNIARLRN